MTTFQHSNSRRTTRVGLDQSSPSNSPFNAVTLREQQEQAALQIYAAATREVEIVRRRLQGVALEIQSAATEFQLKLVRGCTASELAQLEEDCERLQKRRIDCERAIRFAEEALKQALSCWHAARQAREAIGKHLKVKRQPQNRTRRKEQKAADNQAATLKPRRQRVSKKRGTAL